jgi:hypothetical protein
VEAADPERFAAILRALWRAARLRNDPSRT